MGLKKGAEAPILELDELLAPFHESESPRSEWLVGTEAEKFGVYEANGLPVPYEGVRGVRRVLAELVSRYGWEPTPEYEGGELIALRRDGASITLEPGAQLELSGAPFRSVHRTVEELDVHMRELEAISSELGIAWLGLGFHPLAKREELPWVPKLRYGIMREYLPTRGSMSLDMMQRTCTVQANLDYSDEADAMRKLRLGLRISPIVSAMFANSPFVEGQITGERSRRIRVWMNMDPDRSGLLPFAWEEKMSYRRYVEWALDAPMFMVKRGSKVIRNTGQTFRSFMKDGFEGTTATLADWRVHIATLFPEVRLKNTLELRSVDGQGRALVPALPALWKGLLYDETSFAAAEKLVCGYGLPELEKAREAMVGEALGAELGGHEIAWWGAELLELARAGLDRIDERDAEGRSEAIHLEPLARLVNEGRCPADALLERLDGGADLVPALLDGARA